MSENLVNSRQFGKDGMILYVPRALSELVMNMYNYGAKSPINKVEQKNNDGVDTITYFSPSFFDRVVDYLTESNYKNDDFILDVVEKVSGNIHVTFDDEGQPVKYNCEYEILYEDPNDYRYLDTYGDQTFSSEEILGDVTPKLLDELWVDFCMGLNDHFSDTLGYTIQQYNDQI